LAESIDSLPSIVQSTSELLGRDLAEEIENDRGNLINLTNPINKIDITTFKSEVLNLIGFEHDQGDLMNHPNEADCGTRTRDLCFTKASLYQLS
jgi:hypothetical protein